jgi:hypothetical protein
MRHILFDTTLAPPAVSMTASPKPSVYGDVVALTATVTGAHPPTRTVTFREGAEVVPGCAPQLPIVAGVATCATGALPAATRCPTLTRVNPGVRFAFLSRRRARARRSRDW